jgi:hypothetical protein
MLPYKVFLHKRRSQPIMEYLAEPESTIARADHPVVVGASRQTIGNCPNCNNGIASIYLGMLNRRYNNQINMKIRIHSRTVNRDYKPLG